MNIHKAQLQLDQDIRVFDPDERHLKHPLPSLNCRVCSSISMCLKAGPQFIETAMRGAALRRKRYLHSRSLVGPFSQVAVLQFMLINLNNGLFLVFWVCPEFGDFTLQHSFMSIWNGSVHIS